MFSRSTAPSDTTTPTTPKYEKRHHELVNLMLPFIRNCELFQALICFHSIECVNFKGINTILNARY